MSLTLAAGNSPAEEPEEVARVEGITEYRLSNGLRLLLFPDLSRPTVTVNMTVLVGSRHEGAGEGGMAHLLEHMVFKGTPTHPNIPQLLQQRGARFNGTTSSDRTNYFETLPAGEENLEFALHLEADRLVNSMIRGEDLESEMTVVRNEFERTENSPAQVLYQRIIAAAYTWHNYGKPTIGNRSDIERVPLPKLRDFYRKYYQPDNVMVVVAGQFDEPSALRLAQKHFGAIPRPRRKLQPTYTEEPPQDGERSVALRRVGDVGLVAAAYHIPAGSHADFASVAVMVEILAAAPAGRLYKGLVETKLAASVRGSAIAAHDPGMLYLAAEVRGDGDLQQVRAQLLEGVERLATESVSGEEVDRARRRILKARELALADSRQIAISLSSWEAQGDWRLFFLQRDRVEQVTPQSVQQVAAHYLRRNNRTVGLYHPSERPEDVPVPTRPDLGPVVENYKGRGDVTAGEQFPTEPEEIEARTVRSELPAGLQLAMLPKKTRGEAVHVRLTLRYGNLDNLAGREVACSLLATLLARGTERLSRQQLQDELDKNFATLSAGGSLAQASFQIQTKRPYLADALQLLEQILRSPALADEEFQLLQQQRLASLEQARTDPRYLARAELSRLLSPYPRDDVRYVPTLDERIERCRSLTEQQVRELYAQFVGAQSGELVIVGDFDPRDVTPIVTEAFATWKGKQPYARIPQQAFVGTSGQRQAISTPGKANAAYFAGIALALSDTDADYAPLLLGNEILGASGLSSRLGDRVRQQEGLSYGVRSQFWAEALDPRAELGIFAICNPRNMETLESVIQEEVGRWLREGVSQDELTRAKEGFLQRQRVRRSSDAALVEFLGSTLYIRRTMAYYAELERQIEAATKQQVDEAIRKHVDPRRLLTVAAGDFEAPPPV